MKTIEILFWCALALIAYTYLGYGLILYLMVRIKRVAQKYEKPVNRSYEPQVTLLIAAYNEKDYVRQKIENTRRLDYPTDKLEQLWVTDGSDDGTAELLSAYRDVKVLHQPERKGKVAAINRGMKQVDSPIVIFSDANTDLGEKSIRIIVEKFSDPKTGCVSGEKRIMNHDIDAAAGAGEGFYWRYESKLKKWDAELNSVVGAAGELFAVRTELFQEVEPDTLLDDFMISLRIAMKGYSIQYDPEAYALETASANVKEELKRKIRIAAGGIQSVIRLFPLLNIFKYGLLSFQYLSHRVLRWTLTPLALVAVLALNIALYGHSELYRILLWLQGIFYLSALLGWLLENFQLKIKVLFVPFYFFIMNYAVIRGWLRFLQKNQSVNWDRAKRG